MGISFREVEEPEVGICGKSGEGAREVHEWQIL